MFSNNRGNVDLTVKLDPLPMLNAEQIPHAPFAPGGRGGSGPFDAIYANASRENSSRDIILKLVNVQANAQPLKINLQGVEKVAKEAKGEVLAAELGADNSVAEPTKVAPKPFTISDAGTSFTLELAAHSVTVLRLRTR